MRILILTILLITLASIIPASAQMYKWVDKNGTVTFSDTPPPGKNDVESVKVAPVQSSPSIETQEIPRAHRADSTEGRSQERSTDNSVELYVTDWCPYCKNAEAFFRSKGVAYTTYDIDKDADARARKNELDSRRGVPFAVVNGVRIHGYNPARYSEALH